MPDWKSRISGCFGARDLIFAGHPLDEQRAFGLLTTLRGEEIGWRDTEVAFRAFLAGEGAGEEHIIQQMEQVSRHLRPWLTD